MKKDIGTIVELFKSKLNIDISIYDSTFLKKTINKRLTEKGIVFFEDYFKILENNNRELEELNILFHVNFSRFFRNSLSFNFLGSVLLPKLLQSKQINKQTLRIWSAGCATGEEPYSIALLLIDIQKRLNINQTIDIIATDVEDGYLEKARRGNFGKSSLQNIPLKYLEKYFIVENDIYSINDSVKKLVLFEKYDITDKKSFSPPAGIFGNFDLISCRNVLIYMNEENQQLIFGKIYKALEKGAILLLGKSEFIPANYRQHFEKISNYCPLYRKT
jgi:chemotaxis methyl-accepting protein methylase